MILNFAYCKYRIYFNPMQRFYAKNFAKYNSYFRDLKFGVIMRFTSLNLHHLEKLIKFLFSQSFNKGEDLFHLAFFINMSTFSWHYFLPFFGITIPRALATDFLKSASSSSESKSSTSISKPSSVTTSDNSSKSSFDKSSQV